MQLVREGTATNYMSTITAKRTKNDFRMRLSGEWNAGNGYSRQGKYRYIFSFMVKAVRAFAGRKLYMLLDNVRYHHAKRLKPILERYKHKIELVFLPPYSLDLNPVERVWWLMRKTVTHNRWVQSIAIIHIKFF